MYYIEDDRKVRAKGLAIIKVYYILREKLVSSSTKKILCISREEAASEYLMLNAFYSLRHKSFNGEAQQLLLRNSGDISIHI